jgi:hypothetical protein
VLERAYASPDRRDERSRQPAELGVEGKELKAVGDRRARRSGMARQIKVR